MSVKTCPELAEPRTDPDREPEPEPYEPYPEPDPEPEPEAYVAALPILPILIFGPCGLGVFCTRLSRR